LEAIGCAEGPGGAVTSRNNDKRLSGV